MKIHEEDMPFKCHVCPKEFRRKVSLQDHIATHTGEKLQHQCAVCGKEFKQSGTLRRHMLIHSGERPFECGVCKKRFREKSNMLKHMKVRHESYGKEVVVELKPAEIC